jgi:hypothetical protein
VNAERRIFYFLFVSQPGERFKLKEDDIRSAQKMAWYYRTRCKRPINIVIAKGDDGYHCEQVD